MAFCTECGYKLPCDAVFCPNCGTLIVAAKISGNEVSYEKESKDIGTEYCETSACNTGANLVSVPNNPYNMPSDFGYPPSLEMKPKRKNGLFMAIVISAVVIIIALAGFLINNAKDEDNPYVGYWESAAIDNGAGELTDIYLGNNVAGLFGIEINNDGSAYIASAFNTEMFKAQWITIAGGIEVTDGNEIYELTLMNGKLLLNNEGQYIVFEMSDKDINHPSVSHGSLSGSKDTGLSRQPD